MMPLLSVLLPVAGWGATAGLPPDHATAAIPAHPAAPVLTTVAGPPGRPLIVIDPGHGGHDPGSGAGHGVAEKTVALALAHAIRDAVLQGGAARIALTRDGDHWLGLATRREAARALNAALFLSVHCDSTADPAVHGASLYMLAARPSDATARVVAARENQADTGGQQGGGDLPALLTGLAERETRADAARFTALLGRALRPSGVLKADWARAAQLKVLRAPDMPSVLIEAGYLSNSGDRRRLTSAAGQRTFARAVAAAIRQFITGAR